MVAFANPVAGIIHPYGSPFIYGSFRVTAPFGAVDAYHPAVNPDGTKGHQGVDIGNGKCGDPILAQCDGVVTLAGLLGSALVVRYRSDRYPEYELAAAHCAKLLVAKGAHVTTGQQIAVLGSTGANACHDHIGCKRNGVEVDSWPLLIQNGAKEDEMIPIPGANYKRVTNKKSTLKYNGNFRDERKSGAVLELFPAGTVIYPVAYANDGDVPSGSQSGEWWACILYVQNRGNMLGWFHSSVVNPLVDDMTSGYTEQQMTDAKNIAFKAGDTAGADAVLESAKTEAIKHGSS